MQSKLKIKWFMKHSDCWYFLSLLTFSLKQAECSVWITPTQLVLHEANRISMILDSLSPKDTEVIKRTIDNKLESLFFFE